MNQEQLAELATLGSRHHALAAALGMRAELRELWQGRQVDACQALARLATWCESAERAQVPALHAFATHLRAFG